MDVHQQFAEYFPSKEARPFLYLLSKKLHEGHICVDLSTIGPSDFDHLYEANIDQLKINELVSDGTEKQPMILQKDRLYFERFFFYESKIVEWIIQRSANENSSLESELEKHAGFIQSLFPQSVSEASPDWQMIACISALLNSFTIITGGPGTGKTTTVAKILSALYTINPSLKVALAAPTGKAAARMDESLKAAAANGHEQFIEKFNELQPFTLHRLLESRRHSIYFRRNEENPLNYDVVVIDEASMIDAALFAKLLMAIGPHTKLILLGDRNQLSSVEAGSIFGDLCLAQNELNLLSEKRINLLHKIFPSIPLPSAGNADVSGHPLFERVIELKKSYRFSDDQGIGKLSRVIIQNDTDSIETFFRNEEKEIIIDPQYSSSLFNEYISGFKEYILEKDVAKALSKLNLLKVLVAIREGKQGLVEINLQIEKYLAKRRWITTDTEFYENRPVMVTTNNFEIQLFNGDVGIIRMDENGQKMVWFEIKGELRKFPPATISGLVTVYAMTVHKSQGSEFNSVLIILPQQQEIKILTRELLYTAVSRAKKKVVIQGSHESILQIMEAKVKRGSGIQDRL